MPVQSAATDRRQRSARASEAIARSLGLPDDAVSRAYLAGLLSHIPAERLAGVVSPQVLAAIAAPERPMELLAA